MRIGQRRWILGAVLALALGAGASACGGGGGDALTLEEFFAEAGLLDEQFSTDSAAVEARFNELPDDASAGDVIEVLGDQVTVIETFVDGLDDLNAPDEAEAVQERAVDAGREVVDAFRDALDGAGDAETIDDLFTQLDTEALNSASDAFGVACDEARQLAEDNDITASLTCG